MKKKKGKQHILANNLYILRLAWKMCKKRVILDYLYSASDYAGWIFASVVFTKYIFDALEKGDSFKHISMFILGMLVMFFGLSAFMSWHDMRVRPMTSATLFTKLNTLLFEKAAEVDISCYEDATFYNSYTLAIKEAGDRITGVIKDTSNIIFSVIGTFSVLLMMYSIDPYVILFVGFPFIGNFVIGSICNKIYYKRNLENVPFNRRMDYVNRVLYLQNYAKEIRLSKIFNVLKKTYEGSYQGVQGVFSKYGFKATLSTGIQWLFNYLFIFEGILFYSAYRTIVDKSMSISEFAVLASAMTSASYILIELFQYVMNTYQNGLYINNLRNFLNYESKIDANEDGLKPEVPVTSLEMKDVNFTYKGQSEPVIKGLNITIHDKEKIALVGHNGAGKTTIIKLLMRLYDPDCGAITINGQDIKTLQLEPYRNLFGTAFQDFQMFSMTIAENVLMREVEGDKDIRLVEEALKKSGVYERVMRLDKGIHTMLTREFDDKGAVLSGGEYQKIAVARAFAKPFEVAIFDEPSSALDPIAEYKLYESMMEVCQDKAVIFISHRLSSVIHADRIYMLENGSVIEEGTHQELMSLGGAYADMFTKQAQSYIEGSDDTLEGESA